MRDAIVLHAEVVETLAHEAAHGGSRLSCTPRFPPAFTVNVLVSFAAKSAWKINVSGL